MPMKGPTGANGGPISGGPISPSAACQKEAMPVAVETGVASVGSDAALGAAEVELAAAAALACLALSQAAAAASEAWCRGESHLLLSLPRPVLPPSVAFSAAPTLVSALHAALAHQTTTCREAKGKQKLRVCECSLWLCALCVVLSDFKHGSVLCVVWSDFKETLPD